MYIPFIEISTRTCPIIHVESCTLPREIAEWAGGRKYGSRELCKGERLYIIVQVIECSEAKVFGTPEVSTIVQAVMYLHSHLTFLLKLC